MNTEKPTVSRSCAAVKMPSPSAAGFVFVAVPFICTQTSAFRRLFFNISGRCAQKVKKGQVTWGWTRWCDTFKGKSTNSEWIEVDPFWLIMCLLDAPTRRTPAPAFLIHCHRFCLHDCVHLDDWTLLPSHLRDGPKVPNYLCLFFLLFLFTSWWRKWW